MKIIWLTLIVFLSIPIFAQTAPGASAIKGATLWAEDLAIDDTVRLSDLFSKQKLIVRIDEDSSSSTKKSTIIQSYSFILMTPTNIAQVVVEGNSLAPVIGVLGNAKANSIYLFLNIKAKYTKADGISRVIYLPSFSGVFR